MTKPESSQTLEDIFASLEADDIQKWVAERRQEDLTLDFKLAPSSLESPGERKMLAKAISGFSNSSGGLLVWGVDARKDPDTGVDSAVEAKPLDKPELFLNNLTRHSGTAVSPTPARVLHRLVSSKEFAVTFVPETESEPVMAKFGHDRYFKRSGDSFYRMEHYDVSDMFGRRQRPVLALELEIEPDAVLVSVMNTGRGLAKAPYLGLWLPPNFKPSQYGYDGNGTFGLRRGGYAYGMCRFGGDAGIVIHSGQTLLVTKLDARVIRQGGTRAISGSQVFRYEVAAEGLPLRTGKVTLDY